MSGICADLGRCAYAVVEDDSDTGCQWWADCFGEVVPQTADVGVTGPDRAALGDTP